MRHVFPVFPSRRQSFTLLVCAAALHNCAPFATHWRSAPRPRTPGVSFGTRAGTTVSASEVGADVDGDDLTDRFKYKVNALMGTYDPAGGRPDDETQTGNVAEALLNFPAPYSFAVVGRTGPEEADRRAFADGVTAEIRGISGGEDDGTTTRVTPRGENFTKVTVEVTVASTAMMNQIHRALSDLDGVVMSF
mmetsp:Transcript_23918/g.47578  ORF Transcript_23918/g.47578 Transcript_23918/m.47578 type:complete len:192 (+) Transcript_23918:129-704(+)